MLVQAKLWEALSFLAFQFLVVLHYAQRSPANVLKELEIKRTRALEI